MNIGQRKTKTLTKSVLFSATLLSISAMSIEVEAGEFILHLTSYHIGKRTELAAQDSLNEVNTGLGYKTNSYAAGFLKNSEYHTSLYITKEYKLSPNAAINYGLITGYNTSPILPIVSISYRIGNAALFIIPGVSSGGDLITVLHSAVMF